MIPKATAHLGTCTQCAGEGDVITIEADPLPVSLCPAGLARSSGTRRVMWEQWSAVNRKRSAQRGRRRAELERKAQKDLER